MAESAVIILIIVFERLLGVTSATWGNTRPSHHFFVPDRTAKRRAESSNGSIYLTIWTYSAERWHVQLPYPIGRF